MKGNFIITINKATVMEALQQYMNTKFVEQPVIIDIEQREIGTFNEHTKLLLHMADNESFLKGDAA